MRASAAGGANDANIGRDGHVSRCSPAQRRCLQLCGCAVANAKTAIRRPYAPAHQNSTSTHHVKASTFIGPRGASQISTMQSTVRSVNRQGISDELGKPTSQIASVAWCSRIYDEFLAAKFDDDTFTCSCHISYGTQPDVL
jgi:hypothetical protein